MWLHMYQYSEKNISSKLPGRSILLFPDNDKPGLIPSELSKDGAFFWVFFFFFFASQPASQLASQLGNSSCPSAGRSLQYSRRRMNVLRKWDFRWFCAVMITIPSTKYTLQYVVCTDTCRSQKGRTERGSKQLARSRRPNFKVSCGGGGWVVALQAACCTKCSVHCTSMTFAALTVCFTWKLLNSTVLSRENPKCMYCSHVYL